MDLWIVGKAYPDAREVWEFQGVFDDEVKARKACRDQFYFVGPARLNEQLPPESQDWPGAYYPVIS